MTYQIRFLQLVLLMIFMWFVPSHTLAQSENGEAGQPIAILPPPLTYPEFFSGSDLNGSVSYVDITTENEDIESFELSTQGFTCAASYVDESWGIKLDYGQSWAEGSAQDDLKIDANAMFYGASLLKAFNPGGPSPVLFAGPTVMNVDMSIWSADGTFYYDVQLTGFQYGFQISFGDAVKFTPYYIYQQYSGVAYLYLQAGKTEVENEISVAFDDQIIGFDLLIWRITLSSLVDTNSGDQTGTSTTFKIGFSF